MPHILSSVFTPQVVLAPPNFSSSGASILVWLDASNSSSLTLANTNQVTAWQNLGTSTITSFTTSPTINCTIVANQAGPTNNLPLMFLNSGLLAQTTGYNITYLNGVQIFIVFQNESTTLGGPFFTLTDTFNTPYETASTYILLQHPTTSSYQNHLTDSDSSGHSSNTFQPFTNLYRNTVNVTSSGNLNPITSLIAVGGQPAFASTPAGQPPQFGAGYGQSSQFVLSQTNCYIGEILIYSGSSLTNAQILQVQNYLMTKWGITGP